MKTVKEYLLSLRPGDEFSILDLMEALGSDSLTKDYWILEDLVKVGGSILYLGSGSYKRMYTSQDPFIKQIKEAYNRSGDGASIKMFVKCWIKYIPKGSEFRVKDVAAFCPPILADKAIARYLNEYVREGILEKTGKSPILYKRVKALESKKVYNPVQQRFVDFLKKNGILESFSKYLEKSDYKYANLSTLEKLVTGEVVSVEPECWISGVFRWGNTSEGYGFWQEKNVEWLIDLVKSIEPVTGEALAKLSEYVKPESLLDIARLTSVGLRTKYGLNNWKEMVEEEV